MVDANQGWRMPGDREGRWDVPTAARCARELERLGVYWLEEPLRCDDVEPLPSGLDVVLRAAVVDHDHVGLGHVVPQRVEAAGKGRPGVVRDDHDREGARAAG